MRALLAAVLLAAAALANGAGRLSARRHVAWRTPRGGRWHAAQLSSSSSGTARKLNGVVNPGPDAVPDHRTFNLSRTAGRSRLRPSRRPAPLISFDAVLSDLGKYDRQLTWHLDGGRTEIQRPHDP